MKPESAHAAAQGSVRSGTSILPPAQSLHGEAALAAGPARLASTQGATRINAADGPVVLPANTDIGEIVAQGADLVVTLPDGRVLVIVNGALELPELVIGNVRISPANIAALLIGNEPAPTAGTLQSSGGNFAETPGNIAAAFGLGNLLDPTEFGFQQPEARQVLSSQIDHQVTVTLVTPDQPAGATTATATVSETGLPARGSEPAGSASTGASESTSGTIVIDALDAPVTILIGDTQITAIGDTVQTRYGEIVITSISSTEIGYTYTLIDNSTDAAANEVVTITVTDGDGDIGTATLTITLDDDAPTARADALDVAAAEFGETSGNVMTGAGTTSGTTGADTPGADGASVTGVRAGDGPVLAAGSDVAGLYGTLVIAADGSFTYTRNAETPGGVDDVFTYTLTDGDGDTSSATLTIAIADSGAAIVSVPEGEDAVVSEAGLPARGDEPAGSDSEADSESTSGTIAFTAPDGPAVVSINGEDVIDVGQIIATASGRFVITAIEAGAIGYTFTLTDNVAGDFAGEEITVTVTDSDGDSDTTTFVIAITDDQPGAVDDTADLSASDGSTSGNVITDAEGNGGADTPGADGASVTGVAFDGTDGTVGESVAGRYGELIIAADGSYRYAVASGSPLVVGLAAGETATDTFTYTLTDGDGDPATATLTITVTGTDDSVTISGLAGAGADGTVREAALPDGSAPQLEGLVTSGSFSVAALDGFGSLTLAGETLFDGDPSSPPAIGTVIDTGRGTLEVTGIALEIGESGRVTGATIDYTFTLTDNTLAHTGSADAVLRQNFAIVATDVDGTTARGDLVIAINDDLPTARAAPAITLAEDAATTGDNLLADDTPGADGARLTAVTIDGATITVAAIGTTTHVTAKGTYTFNASGDWTFDPASISSAVPVSAGFGYVITDGDGDRASASQTITVTDGTNPRISGAVRLTVNEQHLIDGSAPGAAQPEHATATITVTPGSDAIASIALGDTSGLAGGLDWVRDSGTRITGYLGATAVVRITLEPASTTAAITVTLLDAYTMHPDAAIADLADLGTVRVIATDSDGDAVSATVGVSVLDDLPTITAEAFAPGALTVDESNLATNATADFRSLLDAHFNADGPGDITFSLELGNATGLVDVASGSSVGLAFGPDESVVGYVLGQPSLVVFTLKIDANGVMTLDQQRAVRHPDASNPDDAVSVVEGAIQAVATITDGDGDEASVTLDLSGVLVFRDDAPRFELTPSDANAITVTTQDADTIGIATDTASASFAAAFALSGASYGADGAGTTTWAYGLALGVSAGTTGLTSNGAPVTLALVGGDVVGSAAGSAVFAIHVAPTTGIVTLTQYAELDHPLPGADADYASQILSLSEGLVLLRATATVTDRDGDNASSTTQIDLAGNVRFADDGPSVTVSGNLQRLEVDETNLAANAQKDLSGLFASTLSHGADGAGSVGYALGTSGGASGLVDSLTGEAVIVSLDGGILVGKTATGGVEVFRITVDGAGLVTFDQSRAVMHTPDVGADQLLTLAGSGLLTLTVTVIDGDGDRASATADITGAFAIRDDGAVAVDDIDTVSRDGTTVADGNVIVGSGGVDSNDTDGVADTLSRDGNTHVVAIRFGAIEGTLGTALSGAHGKLTIDANGNYRYALDTADPAVIALGAGDALQEVFTYTIEDQDGDRSTATITLTIAGNNDGPVAKADTNWVLDGASGSDPTTAGNVLHDVAHPGAPGGASFADTADTDPDLDPLVVLNPDTYFGLYGTLVLAADGSYTYYLNEDNAAVNALASGATLVDTFTYTASDGVASSASTIKITVYGTNDAPVIGTATARLSEEGTATGLPDPAPDATRDTTDSASASGSISLTDPDSGATLAASFASPGAAFTVGGIPVSWSGIGTGTLIGSVGGSEVIRATITASGAWTVTLAHGIDHADTSVEDIRSFSLPITLTDGTTSTTRADALTVIVEDDRPVATGEDGSSSQPQQNVNALFVLDFSDSIDNGELNTMITAVKAAITRLDAATVDTLAVRFVIFSSEAFASPSFATAAAANAWLAGLNPADGGIRPDTIGLRTDYTAALEVALANYVPVTGAINNVFFLSDGNPNEQVQFLTGSVVNSLRPTTAAAWNAFVDTNHINVTAIGIDNDPLSPLNIQRLADVDLNDAPNNQPILINDFDALMATLLNVVTPPAFAGDLDANDSYGADGGRILAITIGTVTYTWDGAATVALSSGGAISGTAIAIVTPQGGTLSLDFATGAYDYQPPSPITVTATEVFAYTLIDGDGDTATASLSVTISTSSPPVVLDLDGDGLEFVGADAGARFDFNGDGTAESTAWVGRDDGLLAIDLDGDGKVSSASEIVFATAGLTDLQGLAAQYDSNHDGLLDQQDAAFAQFGVWQDANGDGVADAGEFRSLAARGIASIDLSAGGRSYSAADGQVLVHGEGTYTRTDGTTGKLADVSFTTNVVGTETYAALARTTPAAPLGTATLAAGLVAATAIVGTEIVSGDGTAPGDNAAMPLPAAEPAVAIDDTGKDSHASPASTTSATAPFDMHAPNSAPMLHDEPANHDSASELGSVNVHVAALIGQDGGIDLAAFAPDGAAATPGFAGMGAQASEVSAIIGEALAEGAAQGSLVDAAIDRFTAADAGGSPADTAGADNVVPAAAALFFADASLPAEASHTLPAEDLNWAGMQHALATLADQHVAMQLDAASSGAV